MDNRLNNRKSLVERAAEIISLAAHPFVMVIVLTISSSSSDRIIYSFGSVLIVLAIVLVPLTIFIRRKVRKKEWGNIDASNKKERPPFYILTIALLVLLIIFISVIPSFAFMLRGAVSITVLLAIHALLNNYIKASLHMSFSSFTMLLLTGMDSVTGYFILALIPLLFWARLKLKRHNIPELLTGITAGILVALAALFI